MNLFSSEKILTSFPPKQNDALEIAICFPNTYMIGMASLGYQMAWKLLNQNENVRTNRWFTDIQEGSFRRLERALQPARYVGFSFSWELDYENIFKMLEENKIPLFSKERSENDPLVFAGGQIPNANPEPFCDNFDFFLIGDLEVVAEPFINKIIEIKDFSRKDKLNELSKLPGIYVPDRRYLINQIPTVKKGSLSYSSILTPDSYWPDTFIVEVARSCPELCRFCLASYGSLPFRTPDIKNSLIPIIEKGLKHTNKIGLLGASVTQHPGFDELLDYLLTRRVGVTPTLRVQIASVRADTISKKLAEGLFTLGNKSVTMAIESGSDRIREIINKKVSKETILSSIQTIYDAGINSIKLYGMVGLPTETDEDLNETIKLLKEIKTKNKGKRLSWGCSTFVPKAGTPFQYYGMDKNAGKKLKYFAKELHKLGIEFKPESYEWSIIQGLISRGDRSINKILIDAYKYGSTIGSFKKAIRENKNINSDYFIYANWDLDAELPWGNIKGHLNSELIKKQAKL